MKPGIPWSVKGIEPEARVAAKQAAQQAGMTLGQWLNSVILTSKSAESASDADADAAHWSPPTSKSDQELATLHAALTDMARRFDEVEHNNQEIITHLDRAINEAPDGALPALNIEAEAKLLAQLEETKQELFGRMEALESGLGRQIQRETLKPLEGTLSKIVHHIETSEKRAIEGMRAMEQAISHLAHRMDTTESKMAAPAGIKKPLAELENRIGKVEREARENAEAIQERIYEISNVLKSPSPHKNPHTDDFPADFSAELRFEALEANLKNMEHKVGGIETSTVTLAEQLAARAALPGGATGAPAADLRGIPGNDEPAQAQATPLRRLTDRLVSPLGLRRRRSDHAEANLPPVQPVPVPVPGTALKNMEAAPQEFDPQRPESAPAPVQAHTEENGGLRAANEAPPATTSQNATQEVAKAPTERPAAAQKKAPPRTPEMEKTARVKSPIADLVLDEEDEDEDYTTRGRVRRGVIGAILLSFIIMAAAAVLVLLGDGRFSVSDTLSKLNITSALTKLNITMPEESGQATDTGNPADLSELFPISVTPEPSAALPETDDSQTDPDLDRLLSLQEVPIEDLTRLSAEGNPWAHFRLGLRFLNGQGVAQDEPRGAQLIEQAAQQDLPAAQYRLGALYETGAGLEQDFIQARLWYGKAAFAGNRKAMYNLGVLYAAGDGVAQDYARALEWFSKASKLGLTDSQFNLATLLYRGIGTSPDPIQAYKWFSIAAQKGDKGAIEMKAKLDLELDASSLASAKALISIWQPQPLDRQVNIEF